DRLSGAVVGIVTYAFGDFHLAVTATPAVTSGGLVPEVTTPAGAGQLAVATFNVENLSPADPQSKFDRLAGMIVTNLAAPDLVAVEEIQDNSGPTDDATVAANVTLSNLTAAITRAGGPAYTWREIDPVNDADGGQPGGNIRQVFLYRTDRGLSFVDRPGGTSTAGTSVTAIGGAPALTFSPGRIDPGDAAGRRAVHLRVRGQLAGARPHPAVPDAVHDGVRLRRRARQQRVRQPGQRPRAAGGADPAVTQNGAGPVSAPSPGRSCGRAGSARPNGGAGRCCAPRW